MVKIKKFLEISSLFLFLILFFSLSYLFYLEDNSDQQEIPIPNIRGQTLALVVSFLNHHQTDPMNKIIKVFINFFHLFIFYLINF